MLLHIKRNNFHNYEANYNSLNKVIHATILQYVKYGLISLLWKKLVESYPLIALFPGRAFLLQTV